MKIIILGEICGEAGVAAVRTLLPVLREETGAAAVIACASFSNLRLKLEESTIRSVLESGVDLIVSGNPVLAPKAEHMFQTFSGRLVPAANHPRRGEAPAEAVQLTLADGRMIAVLPLTGREGLFTVMGGESQPATDCPFAAAEDAMKNLPADVPLLVTVASASVMEKSALGHFCAERAFLVAGYGTLCATADRQRLSGGAFYITDCGHCGVQDGVSGLDPATVISLYRTLRPTRFQPLAGTPVLKGIIVDLKKETLETIERHAVSGERQA